MPGLRFMKKRIFLFSVLLGWILSFGIANASPIYDNPAFVKAGTAQVLNNSSTTQPYVITSTNGDNRLLVATLFSGCSGADYHTITYGGVQMTYLATNVDPNGYRYKTFYLFNPETATSTLKVTWPSCSSYAKSISYAFYKNVSPTPPIAGNFGFQLSTTQLSKTVSNSSPSAFWILTTIATQAIPVLSTSLTQRTILNTGLRQTVHDSIGQTLATPTANTYINFATPINAGGTFALFTTSYTDTETLRDEFLDANISSSSNAVVALGVRFWDFFSSNGVLIFCGLLAFAIAIFPYKKLKNILK